MGGLQAIDIEQLAYGDSRERGSGWGGVMTKWFRSLVWAGLAAMASWGQAKKEPLVRMAEIEIDPAQAVAYRAALTEGIDAALRLEPGVLGLYAVAVKGEPSQIRIFEIYADEAAYRAHLETAHFRKYKAATEKMVRRLRLIETEPVRLGGR
jgi:quinol monooxygenase YgiN